MANLHLFTGDEAANTVRGALKIPAGEYLVQHDVLSCGPLHDFASREAWLAERFGFWAGMLGESTMESFPDDLVDMAGRLASADKLILWIGAGLSDRLLLPSVVKLAAIERIDLPPMEIAEVTNHASLAVPVLGWGMLRSSDVRNPAIRPVDLAEREAALGAWKAIASDDPRALVDYLDIASDTEQVNAMSTLIERYPDVLRGLSHWDASLLAATPDAGSSAFTVVGGAIGANHHHLDPVGDMYLFWRLRRMMYGAPNEPLVKVTGDVMSIRDCQVMPTAFGRAVRDGQANHAAVNGIDDWVGGVHLHAATGSPWYRRNGELLSQGAL